MPRTKDTLHPVRGPKISYETCHHSGGGIRCLSCGYLGRSDIVRIHKRRARDRQLERCPECKSLRFVCAEETLIMPNTPDATPEPPHCPVHGAMHVDEIDQGERCLGFLWFCEHCDECEDYDPAVYRERTPRFLDKTETFHMPPAPEPAGQLELFDGVQADETSEDNG